MVNDTKHTKYTIYGPSNPIVFATTVIIANPVCLKHVGKISIACKLMAKNVIETLNFIKTASTDVQIAFSGFCMIKQIGTHVIAARKKEKVCVKRRPKRSPVYVTKKKENTKQTNNGKLN